MIKILVLVVACLLALCSGAMIEEPSLELPISEELFLKLTLSMSKLKEALRPFGTHHENKYEIWRRVERTKVYLGQMEQELAQYNNVILGASNSVDGDSNVVIGNYNQIEGDNNWVFVSNFDGSIDGDLLIGEWRVELDKSHLIRQNAHYAVSFLDESRNLKLKSKFYGRKRRLVRWRRRSY